MMSFSFRFLVINLSLIILSGACKKQVSDKNNEDAAPLIGTRTEFTIDSIYLYARQVYLWNEVLPPYSVYLPRKKYAGITPAIQAFRTELFDITQLKINPETSWAYEKPMQNGSPKYSYLESGAASTAQSATTQNATSAVLASEIITNGGHKVVYIALGSFPPLSQCQSELNHAFAKFETAAPSHLVIDLRSNQGGYVATAEYVANIVAPPSINDKLMFTEQYNNQMQSGNATILKHQPYLDDAGKPVPYKGRNATMADVDYTEAGNTYKFNKKGKLNTIQHVYFITSGSTASAAEMLISVLKPYLNVKLIGQKTYGKPVGFLPVRIDSYNVYLSSFLIKNADGWYHYFEGIQPDVFIADMNNATDSTLQLINGNAVTNRLPQPEIQTNIKCNNIVPFLLENRMRLLPEIR